MLTRFYLLGPLLVAGLALGCGSQTADSSSTSVSDSNVIDHLALSRQRKSFAVFRTPPEPLAQPIKTVLRGSLDGYWNQAQQLDIDTPTRVWAISTTKKVCLVEEQVTGAVGLTCASSSEALKQGIVTTSLSDQSPVRRVVVGVVPDNTVKVRIRTPGFASTTAPVIQNVFVLHDSVKEPPESIELLQSR